MLSKRFSIFILVTTTLFCLSLVFFVTTSFCQNVGVMKLLITPGANYNQFNGMRVKLPNDPAVYLVDQGTRRHIPNQIIFNRLFRNLDIYVAIDVSNIPLGQPISDEAFLARGQRLTPPPGVPTSMGMQKRPAPDPAIYLIDNGVKRWISSPAVMDKYNFSYERVENIPFLALDYIPTGPPIN